MNREQFMQFFRDDEKLSALCVDDRLEIFRGIMSGSSDFDKELIDDTLSDYGLNYQDLPSEKE